METNFNKSWVTIASFIIDPAGKKKTPPPVDKTAAGEKLPAGADEMRVRLADRGDGCQRLPFQTEGLFSWVVGAPAGMRAKGLNYGLAQKNWWGDRVRAFIKSGPNTGISLAAARAF